ncbi:MAG: putative 2-aminoethylphosphonate ABC transporter ATP-binding protein [Paracoccaceae bacterium]
MTTTDAAYLKIEGLWKNFGAFTALRDVNLTVAAGEFVCFLGPSGCGKTTLLRAIAGLDPQSRGTIHQAGKDISTLPPSQRDYGIVFQSYALFPNLTVRRNIAFGLENTKRPKAEIEARVSELLDLVGLPEQADKYPAQLSGGQQQRIALARAIAIRPGLLLLDEPLSALDAKVRVHLRHEIKELQRKLGVTTIMVTHDQEEALSMADRIVVMNQGAVEQVGTPAEVYRQPSSLFVGGFVGEINRFDAIAEPNSRVKIADHTLLASSHDLRGPCHVSIRPEDVIPHGSDARSPGAKDEMTNAENTFDVTVQEMEFLGSFWRCHLENPLLGDSALIANFSINAVRRFDLGVGKRMVVELPSERVLVFPRGA